MDWQGKLPTTPTWDLLMTLVAAISMSGIGMSIRRHLATARRNRVRAEAHASMVKPRRRAVQVRHFHTTATRVISDVAESLEDLGQSRPHEARVLLPLVVDVRRRGENLLKARLAHHKFAWWTHERRLEDLLGELIRLEDLLRSLPKPPVTLDDVLAGKLP